MTEHEGVNIQLGKKNYIIPALSIKSIRRLRNDIDKIAGKNITSDESIDAVLNIIHEAIKRNYPDITKEHLEDVVDLGNMNLIIEIVLNQSGLTKTRVEDQTDLEKKT